MATTSSYLAARLSPPRADRLGQEACSHECGSDTGPGERQDWRKKWARLEAGRELEAGFGIRWCAPRRCGLRAVVGDGEATASKRIPIACALGQALPSEVPSCQVHRFQLRPVGHLVAWADAGFRHHYLASTRPNLALEPTSCGRPSCPRGGPLRSVSAARSSRPAAAVGSALR